MYAEGDRGGDEGVKPHGRDCPHACSICADVPVRRVEVVDGVNVIDGAAVVVKPVPYTYGRGAKRKK